MRTYLVYIYDWRTFPTEVQADSPLGAVACAKSRGIRPPFEIWHLNSCVWRVAEPEFPEADAAIHSEVDGQRLPL
jgi:hypothetical protein